MTNEPSPRLWRIESDNLTLRPPVCFIVDANGTKVSGGFFSRADAALICDAVNERDRLRDIVRRTLRAIDALYTVAAPGAIVRELTPDRTCLGVPIGKIVAEARAAVGEDASP